MARTIHYDPLTGEEIVDMPPGLGDTLAGGERASGRDLVRFDVMHQDDADEVVLSVEWSVDLLAERFAQLVTDVRAMRFAYNSCDDDIETERNVLRRTAGVAWEHLDTWHLWTEND